MKCVHQLVPPALPRMAAWVVLILAVNSNFLAVTVAHADDTAAPRKALAIPEAEAEASTLPSLSAIHVRVHEPSGRELLRADIELSPQGFRVRQAVQGERHREMLQDFASDNAWLIDHRRSVAHRLPLAEEPSDTGLLPGDGASFLSQKACGRLLNAEEKGKGVWRGRSVRAWRCKDDAGDIAAIEFIDSVYGIVVYRQTVDGQIDELRNLKERQFGVGHFTPDSDMRMVSKQEFFGGAPEIPAYQEAD